MEKISIIVPVYNVEIYLERCIISIINQTYQNLEIILVDDGSTDNSPRLCDEWANKDDRIKVIHKINGGLSHARNVGIKYASAQYIGFIDSDDCIADDMFAILYKGMKEHSCDMGFIGMVSCYNRTPHQTSNAQFSVVDKREAINIVLQSKRNSVSVVNKLYKADLFRQVQFPVGKTYEDVFVILKLLDLCDEVFISDSIGYYYMHRENSITTTINEKTFEVIEAYEENHIFIKEKYPEFVELSNIRRVWARLYLLENMVLFSKRKWEKEEKELIAFLKNHHKLMLDHPVVSIKGKLIVASLLIHKNLYKYLVKLRHKKRMLCS